jgi:hypothetical protein
LCASCEVNAPIEGLFEHGEEPRQRLLHCSNGTEVLSRERL